MYYMGRGTYIHVHVYTAVRSIGHGSRSRRAQWAAAGAAVVPAHGGGAVVYIPNTLDLLCMLPAPQY
eukprot:SAG31_NODE_2741_length_5156_cov_3.138817_1_plen_67_part_00